MIPGTWRWMSIFEKMELTRALIQSILILVSPAQCLGGNRREKMNATDALSELVLVETMPGHLRGSHHAAGNWGSYPGNGAERAIMTRDEAEQTIDPDDEYDSILRVATSDDLRRYA